jgi:hypothetical protein
MADAVYLNVDVAVSGPNFKCEASPVCYIERVGLMVVAGVVNSTCCGANPAPWWRVCMGHAIDGLEGRGRV